MPAAGTDSPERIAEMATAIVVDGMPAAGALADPPVPWWSFTKTVLAAAALVLVERGRLSLETPDDLMSVRSGIAAGYHPGWVYHGLLIGPPVAAALLLDRLMTSGLLSPASLRAMQDGFRLGAPIPGRPWQAPCYGLGLMIEAADACRFVGHTGGGPSSTVAVYHFPGRARGVTVAAFAPGNDQGVVERRAVDIARDIARADQV